MSASLRFFEHGQREPYFIFPRSSASSDTTAPTLSLSNISRNRISRVSGRDTTSFEFSSSEDYQQYQIRVVPSGSSPVTAGTLIESGTSGAANVTRTVDVTDDELVAAGLGEATYTVKVFVKDLAGNWSL